MSCAVNRDYKNAIAANNLKTLFEFLEKHPNSKYENVILIRIEKEKDKIAWENASLFNTVDSYTDYLKKHPSGSYVNIAHKKRVELIKQNEIQQEEAAWSKAVKDETIGSYQLYVIQYPKGRYVSLANIKIALLKEKNTESKIIAPSFNYQISPTINEPIIGPDDQKAWNAAIKIGTISSYKGYLKKFPSGYYAEEAEKRIIDKEVEAIISGKHGNLPAPQRSDSKNSYTTSVDISIKNDTKYILTVLYSGPSSRRLVISSQDSKSITLTPGSYSIAAKVNDPSVIPFAGSHTLIAGEYNEKFYIKTTFK